MSGRELSKRLRATRKTHVVRASNGVSEYPDRKVECHSRSHAERTERRLKRDGFHARVETFLG